MLSIYTISPQKPHPFFPMNVQLQCVGTHILLTSTAYNTPFYPFKVTYFMASIHIQKVRFARSHALARLHGHNSTGLIPILYLVLRGYST